MFDVAGRVWATDLVEAAGLDAGLLPRVARSMEIIGYMTAGAAAATGLTQGTPVVAGGGDGACATAGSGAGPGEAYLYLGGTSWIGLNAGAPIADDRLSHYCSLDYRITAFGTVQSAGSSLEWFAAALGGAGFADLDALAAAVPPGARDLFFLPYLQGERAPLWDADARAVFFGLATHHGKAELFRAVVEGVSYALASICDVFAENGAPLPTLRLLGGGAKSGLWRTILAGVTGRRLRVLSDVSSATSLGAAMAAGVGVGLFSSLADASAKLVTIAEEHKPDPDLVAAYAPRAAFFKTLYPALAERFAALRGMV
jgi:xylulokinase